MRITVHYDQLPTYRTVRCAISSDAFGVVCDAQSNCTTASRLLPLWWLPRLLYVCCLKRGWLESLDRGLVTLTSSWLPGALAWSRSPYRSALSNPAFHLTGGLEGPELPACHTLPLLKHNEGEHKKKKNILNDIWMQILFLFIFACEHRIEVSDFEMDAFI